MNKSRREWLDKEIEILKNNFPNMSTPEIAKLLPNMTIGSLSNKASELNLIKNKIVRSDIAKKSTSWRIKNEEDIIIEIQKYTHLVDFRNNSRRAYWWCIDNNKQHLFRHLIKGGHKNKEI